jgi:hypothetical protein
MKKLIPLFLILSAIIPATRAQINLVGAVSNPNTGLIEIVKWEAFNPNSVTVWPTSLQGYLMASSSFNSFSSQYYLTGYIPPDDFGLFSFNTQSNTQSFGAFSEFSNISEIDMATGKIYTLTIPSADTIEVNEYDIATGTDSLLGLIIDPSIPGLVVDAISINSNTGVLHYVGFDNTGSILISIPVRNPEFSYKKTYLNAGPASGSIFGVNYDNVNDKLYGIFNDYDPVSQTSESALVEIDVLTGDVTPVADFSDYPYYQAGSSSFDQNTSSYLIIAFDTLFQGGLLVYDTFSDTLTVSFLPDGISEIVCDNYIFALNNYQITSVPEAFAESITLFPNPASRQFSVSGLEAGLNYRVRMYSASGLMVRQIETITDIDNSINIQGLPTGIYLVVAESGSGRISGKLMIR